MPLPLLLAAKLAKRGLYDASTDTSIDTFTDNDYKRDFKGGLGCPNKNNVYHECNTWCEYYWKPATLPNPKYMRNVSKLLQRYPLPKNWTEVFDKGIKRYYFWDMETDLVSWLPPKHPKCVRSESVAKLREKQAKCILNDIRISSKFQEEKDERKRNHKSSRRDVDVEISSKRSKHDDKEYNGKSLHHNSIDPMDPAAYSDVPIGKWSDGLEFNKMNSEITISVPLAHKSYSSTSDRKTKRK